MICAFLSHRPHVSAVRAIVASLASSLHLAKTRVAVIVMSTAAPYLLDAIRMKTSTPVIVATLHYYYHPQPMLTAFLMSNVFVVANDYCCRFRGD